MQPTTQSIADDTRSALSGLYNVLDLFESKLPASYVKAFLAVAKNEGECVDHYARVCGVGNGPMSRRLNDLGDMNSRNRSLPGFGLLESRPDPMDRRFTIVRLSAKGRALVGRIVGMVGSDRLSEAA
jgi:hypothetical protein